MSINPAEIMELVQKAGDQHKRQLAGLMHAIRVDRQVVVMIDPCDDHCQLCQDINNLANDELEMSDGASCPPD